MKHLTYRLPRSLESNPSLSRWLLDSNSAPLWSAGEVAVALAPLSPELVASLRGAATARRLVRGLEAARAALSAEKRGQVLADRAAGSTRGQRVSRLLILASGCGPRFYRDVERLLLEHYPRVMGVRLDAEAGQLGSTLFGAGSNAQAVMLAHKEAVAAALLAIACGSDPDYS